MRYRVPRHCPVLAMLAALGLTLTAGACSPSTGLLAQGDVETVARDQQVHVTNRTPRPVFTFAVGRDMAARILWAACADPTACQPIEPGRTHSVPYPSMSIPATEREAIVYWWHAIRGATGEWRPDSIRSRIVPL